MHSNIKKSLKEPKETFATFRRETCLGDFLAGSSSRLAALESSSPRCCRRAAQTCARAQSRTQDCFASVRGSLLNAPVCPRLCRGAFQWLGHCGEGEQRLEHGLGRRRRRFVKRRRSRRWTITTCPCDVCVKIVVGVLAAACAGKVRRKGPRIFTRLEGLSPFAIAGILRTFFVFG